MSAVNGFETLRSRPCRGSVATLQEWSDMLGQCSLRHRFPVVKWRQFEPEVILLAVGWYLRFSLSYRDVEELLAERGLHADYVTVWRWVRMPQKWNDVCALGSDRPTTVGEWT